MGLDRIAAKNAFSAYLDEKTFTAEQIQFINYVIDHLTTNGVMKEELLYEQPYTDLHDLGVDGVFPNYLMCLWFLIEPTNSSKDQFAGS